MLSFITTLSIFLLFTMKWIICTKKKFICSILIFIISYLIFMLTIVLSGLKDHLVKADLIVVLGTAVSSEGVPSPGLTARLNKAIEVYQQGYAPLIMVSGGIGKQGYDESLAMENFLIKRGIPKQAIVKDNKGYNTRATAQNTYNYMQLHQLQTVIIISQYYHIARIKLAFRKVGIKQIGSGSTSFVSLIDFYAVSRELLGYPAYWLNIR